MDDAAPHSIRAKLGLLILLIVISSMDMFGHGDVIDDRSSRSSKQGFEGFSQFG